MYKSRKYLEQENRWLWYHYTNVHNETEIIFTEQYDKNGVLISRSSTLMPDCKKRPIHPCVEKIK